MAAGLSISLMKCDLAHNSRSITPLDVSPGADSRLNHRCLDVPFASIVSVQFRRMKAVCLWSGPRNASTALMYSFAQRADTKVVDEPLYGHYLRVTGAQHPLRKEVLAAVNTDGNEVMRALLNEPANEVTRVLFMKQMAHHLVDLDQGFMQQTRNVFLIRDPREMLPSLTAQLPNACLEDTGLATQWRLFERLVADGQNPAVLDSRELLLDPAGVLVRLCEHLDIDYTDDMLTWPAGARAEDGIWASHWYHAVHKSEGFAPYVAKDAFPEDLQGLLAECRPWYDKLFAHAIIATGGQ